MVGLHGQGALKEDDNAYNLRWMQAHVGEVREAAQ
jgi:hypothetical protein